MKDSIPQLRITEIFYSLQGESKTVGLPTVFVRLTGCPLRCQYCDTSYAFSGGTKKSLPQVIEEIEQLGARAVCITGGEPLAQPACSLLMKELCDLGYEVSIETSGAMDISKIDPRVYVVMDLKTPDSNELSKNLWSNLDFLKPSDSVKFVICSEEDYHWSKTQVTEHRLDERFSVLFSSSFEELSFTKLADWIVKDKLNVRFQLQLHKILWNDEPGR
jgi:7-carboxy-7-deazaguanine synthase